MNTRAFGIAGAAALLFLVLGLVFRAPTDTTDRGIGQVEYLLPDLAESLNNVAHLSVADSSGNCTLKRGESGWTVMEKNAYPANMERVRQTLIAASELKIIDPKTSDPDRFEQLGLVDPGSGSSSATKLELHDDEGSGMGSLVIGKRRSGAGDAAIYVRRADENQCWLVSGDLSIRAETDHWLDRDIMKLQAERIRSVETVHAGDDKVVVAKADKTARRFDVQNVPAGRELRYATVGDGLGRALERLTLDNVLAADEVVIPDDATLSTFTTFDGVVVTARLWEADEEKRAAFDVRFEKKLAEPAPDAPDEDADDEDAESEDSDNESIEPPAFTPELLSPEEARAEAEELQERLSPWVFVIPSYAHDRMSKRMQDMLKEEETSET